MKNLEKHLESIREEVHAFFEEIDKYIEKGNKSALRRSRVSSTKITKLIKEFRKMTSPSNN